MPFHRHACSSQPKIITNTETAMLSTFSWRWFCAMLCCVVLSDIWVVFAALSLRAEYSKNIRLFVGKVFCYIVLDVVSYIRVVLPYLNIAKLFAFSWRRCFAMLFKMLFFLISGFSYIRVVSAALMTEYSKTICLFVEKVC